MSGPHRRIAPVIAVEIALSITFLLLAGLWLTLSARGLWAVWRTPMLPGLRAEGGDAPERPLVSAIVAARDEKGRIEGTVRSLLAQRGVDLQVIVVDDRSTDGTGEALDAMAGESPRLEVIHIESLPERWLGKCHALHVGAERARGEWLVFADADVWMGPDVIARAIQCARDERAPHVTLVPGLGHPTLAAKAASLAFFLALTTNIAKANVDHPMGFVGIGAFNMIRADLYRALGGHEALRLEVVDDVKLGVLVRKAGERTRGRAAPEALEVHYALTLPDLLRVLEKNAFAALDYNPFYAAGISLGVLLAVGGAIAGPFLGGWAGVAAFLAMMTLAAPCARFGRRLGWSLVPALLAPLFSVAATGVVLNSWVRTARQRGIRWRETFYSLDMLREGLISPRILREKRNRTGPESGE